ncbi:ORF105 [Ranid herpesvirus 1]|uniref:ORF105 n=1 Tax=Ranid herpesvirus 1 TaxID=85655 RepID=Q14VM5_9VIRU|nr:ORF105 [Ranid herpesvirus 1]ABG25793.1 ORF105 [Ranid herpesvirus 1]
MWICIPLERRSTDYGRAHRKLHSRLLDILMLPPRESATCERVWFTTYFCRAIGVLSAQAPHPPHSPHLQKVFSRLCEIAGTPHAPPCDVRNLVVCYLQMHSHPHPTTDWWIMENLLCAYLYITSPAHRTYHRTMLISMHLYTVQERANLMCPKRTPIPRNPSYPSCSSVCIETHQAHYIFPNELKPHLSATIGECPRAYHKCAHFLHREM